MGVTERSPRDPHRHRGRELPAGTRACQTWRSSSRCWSGWRLLGLFLVLRLPALLGAGAVITGIGVGILTATQGNPDFGGAGVLVSIGAGFLLVTVLGAIFDIHSVRTWPLVPGLALIALGAVIFAAGLGQEVLDIAARGWPALLVLMGAYLLLAARMGLPLHGREAGDHVSDETVFTTGGRESRPIPDQRQPG